MLDLPIPSDLSSHAPVIENDDSLPQRMDDQIDRSMALWTTVTGEDSYRARLKQAASEIVDILIKDFPSEAKVVRRKQHKYAAIIAVLLHSFAHILSRPEEFDAIGVSLNKNSFNPGKRYHGLRPEAVFTHTVKMLVGGIEAPRPVNGLFCSLQGGWFEGIGSKENRTSRLFPMPRLKDFLVIRGLIWRGHPASPKQMRNEETEDAESEKFLFIRMGGKEKRALLERSPTDLEGVIPKLTKKLKDARVGIAWENYSQYEDTLYEIERNGETQTVSSVYETQNTLYRLFNDRDGEGGRIYGHWVQTVPSRLRHLITFRGKPSTEWDYRSQHLALAYSLLGAAPADPERDLYAIDGFDLPSVMRDRFGRDMTQEQIARIHREWFKDVATVSFGLSKAEEDEIALKVLGKGREDDRREAFIASEGHAKRLIDAFWTFHEPVASMRCQSAWRRLQAEDSRISMEIVRALLDQKIPVIPIFDSFIVPLQHGEALRTAMIDAVKDLSCPPKPVLKFPLPDPSS